MKRPRGGICIRCRTTDEFTGDAAGGEPLKPFTQVVSNAAPPTDLRRKKCRRRFERHPPARVQAPSGYKPSAVAFHRRARRGEPRALQAAAYNQAKIGQAPVVVIAVGMKEEWSGRRTRCSRGRGARRGQPDTVEQYKQGALGFLSHMPMDVWVNRHTMIAFTTLMYAAEAYGFRHRADGGFDAAAVKREFGLPDEAEVVALLAIGRADAGQSLPRPLPARTRRLQRALRRSVEERRWSMSDER
jgi:nitroreductase